MKPTHPKVIRGPGGIHCDCCRGFQMTLKTARVTLNRLTRRIEKQLQKAELRNVTSDRTQSIYDFAK